MASIQYIQDYLKSLKMYGDRTVGDTSALPYNLDDVKIKPNDLILADTLNTSLTRLYHNMMYLISQSHFASTMTPQITWDMRELYNMLRLRNQATISWPKPTSEYQSNTSLVEDMLTMRSSYVSPVTNLQHLCTVLAERNKDNTSSITLISNDPECHGEGAFSVRHTGPADDLAPGTWSSNLIDEERHGDTFSNIKSICKDSRDRLYVLDDNIVYQYNVDSIVNRDLSLIRENMRIGRKLTNILGVSNNIGGKTNKYGFENPRKIFTHTSSDGEFIYVIDDDINSSDTTNITIKKYDLGLSWQDTYIIDDYSLIGDSSHHIVDIIPYDGFEYGAGFIGVTSDHKFIFYDYQFRVTSSHDSGATDTPKRIHISKENSNIIYIHTQEQVNNGVVISAGDIHKRYVSNISQPLSTYESVLLCSALSVDFLRTTIHSDIAGDETTGTPPWVMRQINVVHDEHSGKDIIYIAYSTNVNGKVWWADGYDQRVVCVLDSENSVSNLFDGYHGALYELSDIHIKKDEFVNSQVYNKTIGKMVHNLMQLDVNLKGKFEKYELSDNDKSTYNVTSDVVFNGLVYRNEFELSRLPQCTHDLSTYVGVNEIVSSAVLNRCITRMYCWQDRLLKKITLTDGDEMSRKFLLDGQLIACNPITPPTPTPTTTPSVTTTPSLTPSITPSITLTPTVTPTLTPTITPSTTDITCEHSITTDDDQNLITDDDQCIEHEGVDPNYDESAPLPSLSPTPTPTVTPSVSTSPPVKEEITPDTITMVVRAGGYAYTGWSETFKSETNNSILSNSSGKYITAEVTTAGTSYKTTVTSNIGQWDYTMQKITVEKRRQYMYTGVGRGARWVTPAQVGDLNTFVIGDSTTGSLSSGGSTTIYSSKVSATDGSQSLTVTDYPGKTQFNDALVGCVHGWSEMSWPVNSISGVEPITTRASGKIGCNTQLTKWDATGGGGLGQVWGHGPAGTVGIDTAFCFTFTKKQ